MGRAVPVGAALFGSEDRALEGRQVIGRLELDDPEIGVEAELLLDIGIGPRIVDRVGAGGAQLGGAAEGIARLAQYHHPHPAAQQHQHAAGILVAPVQQHAGPAIGGAEPQRHLHPDAGLDAGFAHRA